MSLSTTSFSYIECHITSQNFIPEIVFLSLSVSRSLSYSDLKDEYYLDTNYVVHEDL